MEKGKINILGIRRSPVTTQNRHIPFVENNRTENAPDLKYIDVAKSKETFQNKELRNFDNLMIACAKFVSPGTTLEEKNKSIDHILDYLETLGLHHRKIKQSFYDAEAIEKFIRYNIANTLFRKDVIEALDIWMGYVQKPNFEKNPELIAMANKVNKLMGIR